MSCGCWIRTRNPGPGNTVYCMLAVQLGDAQPPLFRIHRAATGRAPKIMTLEELTKRYAPTLCLHAPSCSSCTILLFMHHPALQCHRLLLSSFVECPISRCPPNRMQSLLWCVTTCSLCRFAVVHIKWCSSQPECVFGRSCFLGTSTGGLHVFLPTATKETRLRRANMGEQGYLFQLRPSMSGGTK